MVIRGIRIGREIRINSFRGAISWWPLVATGGNNAPHEPVPLFEKMRSLTRNRVRDDTGAVIRGKGEQGGRAALFPLPFIKSTCHPDRREGSHLSRFRHYVASHLKGTCRIYKDQAATPLKSEHRGDPDRSVGKFKGCAVQMPAAFQGSKVPCLRRSRVQVPRFQGSMPAAFKSSKVPSYRLCPDSQYDPLFNHSIAQSLSPLVP